jgi:hypothetical protein
MESIIGNAAKIGVGVASVEHEVEENPVGAIDREVQANKLRTATPREGSRHKRTPQTPQLAPPRILR